jgi:hypothetical protein
MQFGTAFEHVRCVRCGQEIRESPVRYNAQWYHAACYDGGLTWLQNRPVWATRCPVSRSTPESTALPGPRHEACLP